MIVYAGPGPSAADLAAARGDALAAARAAHGVGERDPLALRQVVDFARVSLAPGESASLPFEVPFASFAQADARGRLLVHGGAHALRFSHGGAGGDDVVVRLEALRSEVVRDAPGFLQGR